MLRSVAAIGAALLVQGCMDSTILEYEPLTRDLDGRSELHISTYPAGFPRETSAIPFLYKGLRTPEAVYFQVFVRDAEKKSGPNPNIDSIRIHSFSYQLRGEPPVELIADFDAGFWMQDQPDLAPMAHAPVPFDPGGSVRVVVDLTLNGQDYRIEGEMRAAERRNVRPLWIYALD
jgi:hypothetical protein